MTEGFDAYHKWLGISPEKQPANHYQLLGIDEFESDSDVIDNAAEQRMRHLRTFAAGKHRDLPQSLLNEIAVARLTLLTDEKKAAYDAKLKEEKQITPRAPIGTPDANAIGTYPSDAADLPSPVIHGFGRSKRPAWVLPVAVLLGSLTTVAAVLVIIVANLNPEKQNEARTEHAGPPRADQELQPRPTTAPTAEDTAQSPNTTVDNEFGAETTLLPVEALNDSKATSDNEDSKTSETGTPDTSTSEDPQTNRAPAIEQNIVVAPQKSSVPTNDQQQPVLKTLQDAFGLSEQRTNEEKLVLAHELFKVARDTTESIQKFVLLREATNLAAQGGNAELMMEVVDEVDRHFEIDRFEVGQQLLVGYANSADSEEAVASLVSAGTEFIDEAIAAERLNLAKAVCDSVYNVALRKSFAVEHRKELYDQRRKVEQLYLDWKEFHEALALLESDPENPEANLVVGRSYCFEKNDWESGLPFLAKCGDETLKMLAAEELLSTETTEDQVALGDAWWEAAQTASADSEPHFLGRAHHWYSLAEEQQPSKLDAIKIAKRLEEIENANRPVGPIDLLELVRPTDHTLKGTWRRLGDSLESGGNAEDILQIPYTPVGEYSLELNVLRKSGRGGFVIGLVTHPSQVVVTFTHENGKPIWGLSRIDGKHVATNETRRDGPIIQSGHLVTLRCDVRENEISVFADDRAIIQWKGDFQRLSNPQHLRIPNPSQLYIKAGTSSFVVTKMTLMPNTKTD